MKYIIEITNDNPNFKDSFIVSLNDKEDIEQINYFIDDLLVYNRSEIIEDNNIIVELRGNKSHHKREFIIYEDIIQEMINQNYKRVICEVQYKNKKNNNINNLINNYDLISCNCYVSNKFLVIKFLKVN